MTSDRAWEERSPPSRFGERGFELRPHHHKGKRRCAIAHRGNLIARKSIGVAEFVPMNEPGTTGETSEHVTDEEILEAFRAAASRTLNFPVSIQRDYSEPLKRLLRC